MARVLGNSGSTSRQDAENYGVNQSGQSSFSDSSSDSSSVSGSWQDSKSDSESKSGTAFSEEALARIQALYPQLLSQYMAFGQQTPFASLLNQIGGAPTPFAAVSPFPNITMGPIWNENQIQGRVNASRAMNDATAASQAKQLADTTVGRGFGTSSPLYQELVGNLGAQLLGTNTQAENDLRWGAAQGNAKHRLDTEQAGVGRATALNAAELARSQGISEDELRRRQLTVMGQGKQLQYEANRQNALLEAMGFYNQPLPFSSSKSSQKSSGGSSSRQSSSSRQKSGSTGSSYGETFGSSTGGSDSGDDENYRYGYDSGSGYSNPFGF